MGFYIVILQPMTRKIFIGDIHGCADELKILLKKLNINEGDELYFTWDYFTKGPKPVDVAKIILNCKAKVYWVQWNHDLYLWEVLDGKISKEEFKGNKEILEFFINNEKYLQWFRNLPFWIEKEDFILVHAGFEPWESLRAQDIQTLVNIRGWQKKYQGKKMVIFWHDAAQGLVKTDNVIGIDTWCVYWGYLTAFILDSQQIFQVAALDYYTLANKQKWKQKMLQFLTSKS